MQTEVTTQEMEVRIQEAKGITKWGKDTKEYMMNNNFDYSYLSGKVEFNTWMLIEQFWADPKMVPKADGTDTVVDFAGTHVHVHVHVCSLW